MTDSLPSWPREHFRAGGGEPFLFYVIFGSIKIDQPISRGTYKTEGIPKGIELHSYGPENSPEVPQSFLEGYLWDGLKESNPALADAIETTDRCLVLQGTPNDDSSLDYFRDAIGLMTFLAEQGGVSIYDPFMLRWWEIADWRKELFEPFSPLPLHHTVILLSEEDNHDDDCVWIHTRGMRKFGRPDISVHNVPEEKIEDVIDFCSRLIEYQALGHVIPDGQQIKIASLPEGGIIHHVGDLEDPDFNNVHIEVELS